MDRSSDRFDPQRAALAAADAERQQRAFGLAAMEFLQRGQHQPRARHADRMAQRNRAAVDVENFIGNLAQRAVAAEFFAAVFRVASRPAGSRSPARRTPR